MGHAGTNDLARAGAEQAESTRPECGVAVGLNGGNPLGADAASLNGDGGTRLVGETLASDGWAALSMARRPQLQRRKGEVFDYLVVGAGFAGSVLAERLASQADKKVLIVDVRNHIGGNVYDHFDDAGVLAHKYGPHIFHTNSARVFDYLSQFTAWRPYQHRVLASVDAQLVPLPINLETVNRLYGLNLTSFQLDEFFKAHAAPIEQPRDAEEVVVSKVGRDLYNKLFRGYTRKQWGVDASALEPSGTARLPVRTNGDSRYFTATYQAMPLHGYTHMFERMLAHPNINIMLQTDWREIDGVIPYRELIYSGPVDAFFDYRCGKLPYRSLDFHFETHDCPVFQQTGTINYPNAYAYTRSTEFKYLTGQRHDQTSLVYEYPRATGDPYYPVPAPENARLYNTYHTVAALDGVHFVGRLATYKYYNMDQVVGQALALFDKLYVRPATEDRLITVPGGASMPSRRAAWPRNAAMVSLAARSAAADSPIAGCFMAGFECATQRH